MTTFQDQQPQSRRAARQSERAENHAEPAVGEYSDPQAPREMWDTTSRRAASFVAPPSDEQATPAGGRRAAAPAAPAGEPLDYVTQQKPQIPTYDGPSFRPRGATPEPEQDALPPTQAMPVANRPAFRPRDFSPEGRRSAAPANSGWTEPLQPLPADLEYQTEGRPAAAAPSAAAPSPAFPSAASPSESYPSAAAPSPAFPSAVAPSAAEAPIAEVPPTIAPAPAPAAEPVAAPIASIPENVAPERTLTRRELRAMQAAQAAASIPELQEPPRPESPAPSDEAQPWPFTGLIATSATADDAPVEESNPATAILEETVPFSSAAPRPESTASFDSAMSEFDRLAGQQHEPQPVVEPASPISQFPAPLPSAPAVDPASEDETPWTPPLGHWSTQLQQDDPSQPIETTINRTVGSSSATTSALVLPNIPDADIRGPLTGTGEIMLTGSIDLPQSLAATGATGRLEHEGIDRLFESHDAEVVSTDSAPVSAIRAVSTQSGSNLAKAPKPKDNRVLTALLIAAVSMGAVVVAVLAVGLASGIF